MIPHKYISINQNLALGIWNCYDEAMKLIKDITKMLWDQGPKAYFWWSLLGVSSLAKKISNPLINWLIAIFSLLSLIAVLYLFIRQLIGRVSENYISNNIISYEKKSKDYVLILLKEIPSSSFMGMVEKYAKNKAKEWSSDGVVENVTYYLDYDGKEVRKSIQIFAYSQIRKEQLMKQLPNESDQISIDYQQEHHEKWSKISSYKNWRKVISKVIELSASEINRSDETTVQVSSNIRRISISIYCTRANMKSIKHYTYKDNKIMLNGKVVDSLR